MICKFLCWIFGCKKIFAKMKAFPYLIFYNDICPRCGKRINKE